MPNVAIKASGLEKWFGEGEAKTMALRDVDLEADFGEMVYIVGPSGSGKDDAPECSFWNSETQCWERLRGRNRYLESQC